MLDTWEAAKTAAPFPPPSRGGDRPMGGLGPYSGDQDILSDDHPGAAVSASQPAGGGGGRLRGSIHAAVVNLKMNAHLHFHGTTPTALGSTPASATGGITPQDNIAVVSDPVSEAIADVDVKVAVATLKEGKFLLKYCRNAFRKPHQRLFWVDMETLAVKWSSPKKSPSRTQVFLTDVDRIVPGTDSDFWRGKLETERKLAIELLSQTRKLRIVCSNTDEWKVWLRGLLHAHQKAIAKRKRAGSLTNDFIRRQWALADLDHNGSMSFYELVHLLQRLNCQADVRYAEQLFDQFDEDGSSVLEFDEFKQLIHKLLTHQDLMVYFEAYRDKRLQVVTEEGFRKFLTEVQQTPTHLIESHVTEMRALKEPFRKDEGLTDLGFNLLLSSDYNSLITPSKRVLNPRDMTHPLCDYWISSSHNTYLTGIQMIGKSAVSQYIDVLLNGCRCVELDCWDGPDGEPIIYHGHTLTSKIPFEAVIQACRDYGFQKSPYPVILSLEMHCSNKQKRRVGEILQQYLGDRIYRHKAGSPAPSPQSIRGFFIVKGRVPNEQGFETEEGNEDDLLLDEQELTLELLSGFPLGYCASQDEEKENRESANTALQMLSAPPRRLAGAENLSPSPSVAPSRASRGSPASEDEDLEVYYSTISMPGLKLQGFEKHKRQPMEMCSLNENKFAKIVKTQSREMAMYHQHYLSRVYPSGTRVMSSNFNPMQFWLYGCQMAALNFQALGMATLLNLGRFLENGRTGYVLKPPVLRNPHQPLDPSAVSPFTLRASQEISMEITIQILAAQQLPRPSSDDRKGRKRDAACPFVVVTMQGLKEDTVSKRTPHVSNNGLNPRWTNQIFTFEVMLPSVSIIVFEVRHYDSVRSDFLAAAAAPVHTLRPGVRWVTLYDAKLREINWSGLLVHASIKPSRKMGHAIHTGKAPGRDPSAPTENAIPATLSGLSSRFAAPFKLSGDAGTTGAGRSAVAGLFGQSASVGGSQVVDAGGAGAEAPKAERRSRLLTRGNLADGFGFPFRSSNAASAPATQNKRSATRSREPTPPTTDTERPPPLSSVGSRTQYTSSVRMRRPSVIGNAVA